MLQKFRWQFIALFISLMVFAGALAVRFSQPEPVPTTTASPVHTPMPAPTETTQPTIPASSVNPVATTAEVQLPQQDDRFVEGMIGSVTRLNPLLATTQAEKDIVSLIFEGLTQINQYGEAVPNLARTWVMSRDGLEYVFTLRQDIFWQDGIAFTAEDVLYTISLLSSEDFPGLSAERSFWQTVEVEYLASNLIRFRLAQPLGSFPTLLSFGILPFHALQGTTASQLAAHPFNLTPIGTGPYQLQALRSADNQTIQAVDLHFAPAYRSRPESQNQYGIQKLRFVLFDDYDQAVTALSNNEIDGLAARSSNDRQILSTLSQVNLYTAIEPAIGMLIFNWEQGDEIRFFADQRVRTALQIGLDRRNLVESNLLNRAILASNPVPLNSWAYDASLEYPQPNATRALELLSSASIRIPEGSDTGGKLFRFAILTSDDPAIMRMANEIATQWSQYNLAVSVESVSQDQFNQRLADGDFDATIVELSLPPEFDAYFYWHSSQYPDGLNYGGVSDERINEALERARRENNGLNRIQLYREFQRTFLSRAIAIPLYYPLYTYAVSDRIAGIQLGYIGTPENRFRTLANWMFP